MKIIKFDPYDGTVLAQLDNGDMVQVIVPLDSSGENWISGTDLLNYIRGIYEVKPEQVELAKNKQEIEAMVELPDSDPSIAPDKASAIRAERDARIFKIMWRVERYNQQKTLGVPTEDTENDYMKLLAYIELLRRVPSQAGFPDSIKWPELDI